MEKKIQIVREVLNEADSDNLNTEFDEIFGYYNGRMLTKLSAESFIRSLDFKIKINQDPKITFINNGLEIPKYISGKQGVITEEDYKLLTELLKGYSDAYSKILQLAKVGETLIVCEILNVKPVHTAFNINNDNVGGSIKIKAVSDTNKKSFYIGLDNQEPLGLIEVIGFLNYTYINNTK